MFRRNPLCCLRIRFSMVLVASHRFSTSRGPAAAQVQGAHTGFGRRRETSDILKGTVHRSYQSALM